MLLGQQCSYCFVTYSDTDTDTDTDTADTDLDHFQHSPCRCSCVSRRSGRDRAVNSNTHAQSVLRRAKSTCFVTYDTDLDHFRHPPCRCNQLYVPSISRFNKNTHAQLVISCAKSRRSSKAGYYKHAIMAASCVVRRLFWSSSRAVKLAAVKINHW